MDDAQAHAASQHIRDDLLYLAGKLPHRSAQTFYERDAARYIKERLHDATSHADIQEFSAIESYRVLFGTYYLEFIFVGLLAIWWPWAGAVYGLYAFTCYLAEFMGFRIWARLMPEYETQNVIAQFFAEAPRRTIVVMAHYDSGTSTFLEQKPRIFSLTTLHDCILLSMVWVIVTCAVEAILGPDAVLSHYAPLARWLLIGNLAIAGGALMYSTLYNEDLRGANNNASGVCALLQTARELAAHPVADADIYLVATGSHESWMAGTRHFLDTHHFDKRNTTFINLESVGAGKLHILEREGLLHKSRLKGPLRDTVLAVSRARDLPRATLTGIPTAAHILHARGFHAVTLMTLNEDGIPEPWNSPEDTYGKVDESTILEASEATLALIQTLSDAQP